MKHVLTVNSSACLFTVTTEGKASAEGIIALASEIIAHPKWKPGSSVLLDHRKLKLDGINMNDIETVAQYFMNIGSELGDGRVALVMKRDLDFGIARTWEVLISGEVDIAIEVFRSIDEAQKWVIA